MEKLGLFDDVHVTTWFDWIVQKETYHTRCFKYDVSRKKVSSLNRQ
jgi:hypothetical protein